jgi:nickel/cobalt transporter (NicO) family protein
MQLVVRLFSVVLLMLVFSASLATAQSTVETPTKNTVVIDKRKLLVQPKNADGSVIEVPFSEDPVMWMRTKQQNFYGRMSTAIRQMKSSSKATAAWTLLTLSFFYGVFHAAGPGHGKAVVAGWVLATENELKRGIAIAFLSALFQALTAITIVSALLLLVSGASAMARNVANFLESASYAMIAAMGLYLIWNGWRGMAKKVKAQEGPFELVSRPSSGHALTDHVHDENCGHAHAPAAADLKGDWTWTRAVTMAFAVGLRPCSGAILVLISSYSLGLYWAGVLSTLAMGFGVFLTIASIASLAVYAKSTALKFAGADTPWLGFAVKWGKVAAGLFIAAFGSLLFLASLGAKGMVM